MTHPAPPRRPSRYEPVDVLTLAYLALVFLGIAALGTHLADRVECLAVHLVFFLVVRILVPMGRRSTSGPARFLADFYPLLFYTLLYVYANRVNTIVFAEPFDPFFRDLDRRLFGVEPSFWLAAKLGTPVVHEIVHALYFSYYVQVPAVGLILYLRRGGRVEFRRFLFVVCLTFYVSYLTFIVLPVHGPYVHRLQTTDYNGVLFVPLLDFIYSVGETGGGAFPSSHVAVSLVCLLFCLRRSRALFFAWLVPFLGLTFGTVYCRYHWAVDSIAGIAWGFLWFGMGLLIWRWWRGNEA